MNEALRYFAATPRIHNCAQAIMAVHTNDDPASVQALANSGGGKAPDGMCGALYAAMLIAPKDQRDMLIQDFIKQAGSASCLEIKASHKTSCDDCVRIAAEWLEAHINPIT